MQRGDAASTVRADEEGEERLSLYLLEISLVLAFIAAACIPARCAYASVLPADVYDAGICFGGSLLRDARRKESTTRLPFASFYTSVAVTRHEDRPRIVKERVSGLEIGESSDDFRINPYYWAVVRFDYQERKRRGGL